MIKEYFASYFIRSCDVTFDLRANTTTVHTNGVEPWKVTLVDTGDKTMTGGRIKRARDYIGDETFCLTYGDCVGDVDITALIESHRREQALATLTAVQPPGRFGALQLHGEENRRSTRSSRSPRVTVRGSTEASSSSSRRRWTTSTATIRYSEQEPLQRMASEGRLAAYRHRGYWQPLNTFLGEDVPRERVGVGIAGLEGVVIACAS